MKTAAPEPLDVGTRTRLTMVGLLLIGMLDSALAQNLLDNDLWVTNKRVQTMERVGDTLYIGGNFNYVGPVTGPGASFDAASGELKTGLENLLGHVNVAEPDGFGGWFVGGEFSDPVNPMFDNLIHVSADGSITALPTPNGPVSDLLLDGQTLYVGGSFVLVDNTLRRAAAALDVSDFPVVRLLPWHPNPGGSVSALESMDGAIILGGHFTSVGGAPRMNLAAVDPLEGAPLPLSPQFNSRIMDVSRLGDTLYVVGYFTEVNGLAQRYLAAIDLSSGQTVPWWANAAGAPSKVLATESAVFISGVISHVNHTQRYGIAALHPDSGALLPWDADLYPNHVADMWISEADNSIYVAGGFTRVADTPRHRFAELDLDTAALRPLEIHAGRHAFAVAKSGDNLFLGGLFNSAGGVPRTGAAALDLNTGAATDWDMKMGIGGIIDMRAGEDSLFVVGSFGYIGSAQVLRHDVAEVDLITGEPTDWEAPENDYGQLHAVEVTDDYVYIGGGFRVIGGVVQSYLAELDRETGALSRPIGGIGAIGHRVRELLYDRTRETLYVGGGFIQLGGLPRRKLAAYDVVTGTITDWAPDVFPYHVDALASRGDDILYVGGDFTTVDDLPRSSAAAISKSTGRLTGWNPSPGGGSSWGTLFALVATDAAVYMGGPVCWMAGQQLPGCHVAAVDSHDGDLLDWHPATRGQPDYEIGSGFVFDLLLDDDRMYIGGAYLEMLGANRGGLGVVTSLERPVASLHFDPPHLQFGDVEMGEASPQLTTTLSNTGTAEAVSLELAVGGNAGFEISGSNCGTSLAAGANCQIQLRFSPTARGLATATLTAGSEPGSARAHAGLGGNGLAPAMAEVDPPVLALEIMAGEAGMGTLQIANTGETVLEWSITTGSDCPGAPPADWLGVSPDSGIADPGETAQTVVVADGNGLAPDEYEAILCLTSNDPLNPTIGIPVVLTVTHQAAVLEIDSNKLSFGEVLVDNAATLSLDVFNMGGAYAANLSLDAITVSGDAEFAVNGGDCVVGGEIEPGGGCSVEVTFAPDSTGTFSGSVTVEGNGQSAVVTLSGTGIELDPGVLELTPDPLDFDQVVIDEIAIAELTLANTGTETAAVLADTILVVGVAYSDTGTGTCEAGASVLAPGQSCTIAVVFAPTGSGSYAGNVVVQGSGGERATATLIGTGVEQPDPADDLFSDRFEPDSGGD